MNIEKLTAAMYKKNISYERLAKDVGISAVQLVNWVNGTQTISAETILEIANILNIPAKSLL